MRFLIDEDLSTEIAEIAQQMGLDVVSVQEVGRRGWTDEEHLVQAAEDGRCIVTANRDHFEAWTSEFFYANRPHAGVLIVRESLRRRGSVAVARALVAFERTRGHFPAEYLCDFLQPAE
jgi:predicted nuclease of predicted toxin-antitoxin system